MSILTLLESWLHLHRGQDIVSETILLDTEIKMDTEYSHYMDIATQNAMNVNIKTSEAIA